MLDQAADVSRAVDSVVSAFTVTPVVRWLWANDDEYARHFAALMECYLPSERQGHGLGGHLLDAALEYIDQNSVPVFLEAMDPRNIPFFEKRGFMTVGSAQAGSSPVVTCMQRPARTA